MAHAFVIVIFGATGDLMHRKLMPAISSLRKKGVVGQDLFIVGVGRRELSLTEFRDDMKRAVQAAPGRLFDPAVWETLAERLAYERGFFEDPALYTTLATRLARMDKTNGRCLMRFLYLATPPVHYETILANIAASGLARGCGHAEHFPRILIEKPFGHDLSTAQALERKLSGTFEEKQIYRIDHYLGKETVQDILSFRFANGIFEPTWNRQFIDHVQIALLEGEGVGNRGVFYDGVGAIRDVVQNHVLQMLALTAMEQPHAFDAESIRDERARAIAAIAAMDTKGVRENTVRGQYSGYTKEKGVEPDSKTETYVCLKVFLESERWRGVPFYLRTGKNLGRKVTEISIHYKKPTVCTGELCLFPEADVLRNVLAIRIQPDDGVSLRLMVKKPGFGMKLTPTAMSFHYRESFPDFAQPEAYEKLLLDAIAGDQTLFARTDGVMASWKIVTNILEGWAEDASLLYPYPPGSMGPSGAEDFITRDGRRWFLHEEEV